jgi:hypothetical protein
MFDQLNWPKKTVNSERLYVLSTQWVVVVCGRVTYWTHYQNDLKSQTTCDCARRSIKLAEKDSEWWTYFQHDEWLLFVAGWFAGMHHHSKLKSQTTCDGKCSIKLAEKDSEWWTYSQHDEWLLSWYHNELKSQTTCDVQDVRLNWLKRTVNNEHALNTMSGCCLWPGDTRECGNAPPQQIKKPNDLWWKMFD